MIRVTWVFRFMRVIRNAFGLEVGVIIRVGSEGEECTESYVLRLRLL